ncbi:cAMP-dependent protein kinase inhibitor gamma isoform X1 [Turdus rufiventris]|nr:cAMP-dependent protein kinase inhibitor gamma isoform X1 [Turdus rufiventris]
MSRQGPKLPHASDLCREQGKSCCKDLVRLKEKAGNSKESQTLCLPVQNTWDGSLLPSCPQLACVLQVNRDAMEVESSTYTDFISCDRAGRRNAVHDIQREATTISMRKLTEDMGDLAVEGAESQRDASSSDNDPGARPKGQESSPSP